MTDDDRLSQDESDFEGWTTEEDGTLRLWPMQGFSCRRLSQGVPALRIAFLAPAGCDPRCGALQVHMSLQQASLLAAALLSAVKPRG